VIDEIGAGLGCAMMDWTAKNIIVARDEAIYSCGVEGRGACYAYEGDFSVIDFLGFRVLSWFQATNPLSIRMPTTL